MMMEPVTDKNVIVRQMKPFSLAQQNSRQKRRLWQTAKDLFKLWPPECKLWSKSKKTRMYQFLEDQIVGCKEDLQIGKLAKENQRHRKTYPLHKVWPGMLRNASQQIWHLITSNNQLLKSKIEAGNNLWETLNRLYRFLKAKVKLIVKDNGHLVPM